MAPPQRRPTTVLLLRTPVPPKEGTDPYHDVFGTFCLPSFPMSALDSGAATPIAPFPHLAMIGGASDFAGVGRPLSRSGSGSSADRVRVAATLAGMTLSSLEDGVEQASGGSAGAVSTSRHSAHHHAGPRPEELLLERLQQQHRQQAEAQAHEASAANRRAASPQRNYSRRQPSYSTSLANETTSSALGQKPTAASLVLTTHHASVDATGADREWCVSSLPVLGSQNVNSEQFEQWIAEQEWGGVVATSNRAWDAWRDAVKTCRQNLASSPSHPRTIYSDTPFFLISSRSAATFRQTLPETSDRWVPKANKVYGAPPKKGAKASQTGGATGADTTAGEALGEYILGWLQRRRDAASTSSDGEGSSIPLLSKPLLLLQGDKSLAALPNFLEAHSIPFRAIQVYETCADQALASNLSRLQIMYQSLDDDDDEQHGQNGSAIDGSDESPSKPDWIVFFSPSGVDYSRQALDSFGWFPRNDTARRPRLVTLGSTTGNHLKEQYGFSVAAGEDADSDSLVVVATSADPQGIKDALDRVEATTTGSVSLDARALSASNDAVK